VVAAVLWLVSMLMVVIDGFSVGTVVLVGGSSKQWPFYYSFFLVSRNLQV